MIIGIILRNIKTYSGVNYIPLTYGQNFSGLVGNNGIGKSSVLEALDSFFNGRQWNCHKGTKKNKSEISRSYIVPIFLLGINNFKFENFELTKQLSDSIWQMEESDFTNPQNKKQFKTFSKQLSIIKKKHNKDTALLLPIGVTFDDTISLGFFPYKKFTEKFIDDFEKPDQIATNEELKIFEPLLKYLKNLVEYIYIPKDIDHDSFTQLETKEIQSLMGESLIEIIEKCLPHNQITEINKKLNEFTSTLASVLVEYEFKTVGDRQVYLKKNDFYKLIIEAYFKNRKLHKTDDSGSLEISKLSSGEKQKAIIELAYHFLKSYRKNTDNIILAIDEPEASLHISACYDQFNKLFEVSLLCNQLIFTTHWYGFIPTIEDGCICSLYRDNNGHYFNLVSAKNYREEIKQDEEFSNKSYSDENLSYDIRLKSINDFTQAVITSILIDDPYNWLVCEGSSDKIYLEKYLEEIKKEKKLRIIAAGGVSKIKRIYDNLQVPCEEFRKKIKGKVILISDTDESLVKYQIKDNPNLLCKRIVNSNQETKMVNMDSNLSSPKTEIEDTLNGKLFFETLKEFKEKYDEINQVLEHIRISGEELKEIPSFFALDLPGSKQKILEDFFNKDDNKINFANKYIEKLTLEYKIPNWIDELKKLY